MAKVNYIGPFDEVVVHLPTGGVVHAKRDGDAVDVPDALAAQLLEQPTNWLAARSRPTLDDLVARAGGLGIDVGAKPTKASVQVLLDEHQAELDRAELERQALEDAAPTTGELAGDIDNGQAADDTGGQA